MIDYLEKDGALTFSVRVVPRASRTEIVGEQDGMLRVRVAAPPVDGAANEEVIRLIARALRVKRGGVTITAGLRSRIKKLEVTGIRAEALGNLTTPR